MTREIIRPIGIANSPNYSHAVVKAGMPVFLSGQVGLDAKGALVGDGDAAAQSAQAFQNVRTVVAACGGTMEDIVKLTVYTTDLAHRAGISEARARFFAPGKMPASTFVVVKSLADPKWIVEIEAVAMIGG